MELKLGRLHRLVLLWIGGAAPPANLVTRSASARRDSSDDMAANMPTTAIRARDRATHPATQQLRPYSQHRSRIARPLISSPLILPGITPGPVPAGRPVVWVTLIAGFKTRMRASRALEPPPGPRASGMT
jgi:hypothetical protein